MFEVKYDRDGQPITPKEAQQPQELVEQVVPVIEDVKEESEPHPLASESSQPSETSPVQRSDKSKETNLRIMRERAERAELERNEILQRLKQIEERTAAQSKPVEEDSLNPNDLVEWKHVDKKIKNLQDQIKDYQERTLQVTTEARIKAQYPDFEKVVSQENLEMFRESYPELASTLNATNDLYSKAVSAYTLIKKFGLIPEDTYQAEKLRIQANATKPKPLASISPQQADSPLSHVNSFASGLTDDLKKQLFKEMNESRKAY